jgi:uncharacterized protein YjbK
MKTNIEKEYKCLITKQQHRKLVDFYENQSHVIYQRNVYYQDQNGVLKQTRAVLRQRFINDECLITFKYHLEENLYEYEFNTSDMNDPTLLDHLLKFNIKAPFEKIGELITIRHSIDLKVAELCIDENHYGDHIDYEIEYEIKTEHDGLTSLQEILHNLQIPYQENTVSKFQRCTNQVHNG